MTTKLYLLILFLFIFLGVQGQDTLFFTVKQMRDCTTKTVALLEKENVCTYANHSNNMITFYGNETISFSQVWHLEGTTDFGFLGIQTTDYRSYIILLHKGKANAITANLGQQLVYGLKKQCPNGNTIFIFKFSFRGMLMTGTSYAILLFNAKEKTYKCQIIDEQVSSMDVKTGETVTEDKQVKFEFEENSLIIHEHTKSILK